MGVPGGSVSRASDRQSQDGGDAASGSIDVSVICPFYNESAILEDAIGLLLKTLQAQPETWELIVVDDGSSDDGADMVRRMGATNPGLHLVSYMPNRGRGHALRRGIARARGAVVVTTEIDLSWGEDVVKRLCDAMRDHPEWDMVVASPHLPGGGYRNVPPMRVFLRRLGNWVIRTCISNAVTMNTGMTRAYRREVIQSLPLDEDRKEFHLEVVLKARALGYRIGEIPCILEWRNLGSATGKNTRKSSTKVKRLMVTHTLFSLFANPIRYVWALSALAFVGSAGFLIWGVVRLFSLQDSIFVLLTSLSLGIIALIFFTFGVIAQQGNMVQREIWLMRQEMRGQQPRSPSEQDANAH